MGTDAISVEELNNVVLSKKLGAGTYGSVYVGLLPSGRFVAVKALELDDDVELGNEVEIHKTLVHPNITRYLHSRVDVAATPKVLYLYLEIVTGGSVATLMKTLPNKCLPLSAVRVYSRHMFLGLEYLHKNKVAHRDVKGENLLISIDTGIAKLADFDQAKVMNTHGTLNRAETSTISGTPSWMAPEMIMNESGYDPFLADIWSAGCTVAEMITGKAPWVPLQTVVKVISKLVGSTGWPDAIPRDPKELGSQDAFDFLDQCFQRDVNKRPSAAKLLKHPFLTV